jgi:anti-anti-sigma factor
MRGTGCMTDVVPPSRWDGHHLLLAPVEQVPGGLVGWAEHGLDRGDKLIYAGRRYRAVEELVAALAEAGLEAGAAADDGRLEVVERARFYSDTGCPALVDEARRQGFRGVRTFGGPAAAAGLLDGPAFDRFEHTLDRLCATPDITAVCCYDAATTTGADQLHRAVERHPAGWSGQLLHAYTTGPGRLRLVGEVDVANDRMFAAVCARALGQAGPVLVLECAELTFMSVSGWRALAAVTADFRAAGGRVRLAGLTKLTTRTLQMLGYEGVFELEPVRG